MDKRYFAREFPGKFKLGITGCRNNCLKAEENDIGIKGGTKVKWIEDKCISCGVCVKACREKAITMTDGKIEINQSLCNFCGRCTKSCPVDAYENTPGYVVSFGGLFGNKIHKGEVIIPFIEDKEKLVKICDATMDFFGANAKPGDRLRFTIDRYGADKFKKLIEDVYYNG